MVTQIHVEHVFVEREADSCASKRNCQAVVVVKDEPMDDYESTLNLNTESIVPEFSSAVVKLEPREYLHGDSREQHKSAETCIDISSIKQCIVQALDNFVAADNEERIMKGEINEALVKERSATSSKESSVEHVSVERDAVESSVRYRQTVAVKDEPMDDYESTSNLNTENIVLETSSAPVKFVPEESLHGDSREQHKSAETCIDISSIKQCIVQALEDVVAADKEGIMKDEINEALVEERSPTSSKESSDEHVLVERGAVEACCSSERYLQTVVVKDEPMDDYESTSNLNTETFVLKASSSTVKLEPEECLPSDSRKRRKSAETCTDNSPNKQCKIEQMEEQEEPQPFQLQPTQPVLMAAKKIVKFSHFFIRKIKTFGNRNHELIHFISDEKDLCYSYFYERKHTGNRFSCITCSKSKHSAIAHLRCDTDSGEYFLELGLIKHICTPLNYDASVCIYILPCNFYSSMFINPSKTEKNRGFRIVSQDEAPKVVQKTKNKKARFHDTIAQMVANNDTVTIPQPQSSNLSELANSIDHSPQSSTCDTNETAVPASSLILKAPDFELRIVKNFYGVEKYRLIVFTDPDRTLCYVFFQQYPHMRFTCRKCQYYRPNITAFLRESDEGEKYVYFNQHPHQCQPLNYANVVQED